MKRFLLAACSVACVSVFAQNGDGPCACDKDFSFLTNYLENHYSSFPTNVTDANRAEYNNLKRDLAELNAL